jgi:hypothetical protein
MGYTWGTAVAAGCRRVVKVIGGWSEWRGAGVLRLPP